MSSDKENFFVGQYVRIPWRPPRDIYRILEIDDSKAKLDGTAGYWLIPLLELEPVPALELLARESE